MLDPLSSIFGILGACDVILRASQASFQYVSDVKAAPKNFKRIQLEIQNLQAITAALGEFLKSEKVKTHGFGDSVPIAKALEECKVYISKLQEDFTAKSQRSHLLWPLSDKKEVQQTLQDLDRFTTLFHWALSVNGWSFFCDSIENVTKTLEGNLESYENMARLLKPFPEVQADIKDINDHCKAIRSVLQVFTNETILSSSSEISKILVNVENIALKMQNKADYKERKEILEWISTEDFSHKQRDVSSARQGGTSTWMFETPEFDHWATTTEFETLWCHGIPGSGKTVVFGAIVDWLIDRQSQENTAVAVVYFDYKEESICSSDAIFLSILKQLCDQSYQDPQVERALKDLKGRCQKERDRKPVLVDCYELLERICEIHKRVFICCDGLDELPDKCCPALLKTLNDLYQRYKIKILLTSRENVELKPYPDKLVKCPISATLSDLQTYLEARIDAAESSCLIQAANKSSPLREHIITTISAKAKGMFLLAELHIKQLESAITERQIRKWLRELPEAIDDHYQSYIERIKTHSQGAQAMQALLWIYSSYRSLSPEELLEALSIEDGDSDLDSSGIMTIDKVLSITGGLLTFEKENNTVRLVHETLQEFLKQRHIHIFPDANLTISKTLATYLNFKSFDTTSDPLSSHWITLSDLQRSHKLLRYAFLYWADHVRDAGLPGSAIGLDLAVRIASSLVLLRLMSIFEIFCLPLLDPEGFVPLHIAILWKSEIVVEAHLAQLSDQERNLSIGHKSKTGLTPLHLAARNNSVGILKQLCGLGANIHDTDILGRTAVYFAAACSNLDALRFFIKLPSLTDSNRHRLINFADKSLDRPLHRALQNGHEASVRELLLAGADVEATTATGQTPLHYAVIHAPQLTDLLLHYGASVKAKSQNGRNSLHWACIRGTRHSITVLLGQGCDPNLKAISGESSLHLLAQAEIEQAGCVGLLVKYGAHRDATDNKGWTPLHRAIKTRHFETAKGLIDLGANVYIRTYDGLLPLQLAAAHEDFPFNLWTLLGDVNSIGIAGETPLHVAARAQRATEVENLVKFYADPNIQNKNGETSLHLAVQHYSDHHRRSSHLRSRSDVVSLLLDNGADISLKSNAGVTPLDIAIMSQSVSLIKMFGPYVAPMNRKLSNGTSFLEYALLNGELPSINILLRHDADGKDPCLSTLELRNAIQCLFENSRALFQQGQVCLTSDDAWSGSRSQNKEQDLLGKQPFGICKLNCPNTERCTHMIDLCEKAFLLIQHAVPSPMDSNWEYLLDMFRAWCSYLGIPLLEHEPVPESCQAALYRIFGIIQNPELPDVKEVDTLGADDVDWNDNAPLYDNASKAQDNVQPWRSGSVAYFSSSGFFGGGRGGSLW